jgi:hypothetical protein
MSKKKSDLHGVLSESSIAGRHPASSSSLFKCNDLISTFQYLATALLLGSRNLGHTFLRYIHHPMGIIQRVILHHPHTCHPGIHDDGK